MKVNEAKYIQSTNDYQKCPPPDKPEFVFIGRSNVGKSSLINMLANHKGLAKTSQTPGKTQIINHFLINNTWYLVDLPGYGYAKVSKTEREKWEKMINDYLFKRENLTCVFVLVDARLEPQKIDVAFINKLGENGLPLKIIFTKADKINIKVAQENIEKFKNTLLETWEEMPEFFLTSSEKGTGKEDVLNNIGTMLKS
jgi:GTP-binding protein